MFCCCCAQFPLFSFSFLISFLFPFCGFVSHGFDCFSLCWKRFPQNVEEKENIVRVSPVASVFYQTDLLTKHRRTSIPHGLVMSAWPLMVRRIEVKEFRSKQFKREF